MIKEAADFIGSEAAKRFVFEMKKRRGSGSFLFVGPDGVGKASFAKWLIRELHDGQLALDPDLFVLEGDESIKIDEIRELTRFISLKAVRSTPKIALIVRGERLGLEAANALLKTLEEPVGESLIIITATSPELLLPTIVSRCLVVRFGLVAPELLETKLKQEEVDKEKINRIVYLSGGRVGEALRLARQEGALEEAESSLEETLELILASEIERLVRLERGIDSSSLKSYLRKTLWATLLLIESKRAQKPPLAMEKLGAVSLPRLIKVASLLEEALLYLSRNQNANLVFGHLLLELGN